MCVFKLTLASSKFIINIYKYNILQGKCRIDYSVYQSYDRTGSYSKSDQRIQNIIYPCLELGIPNLL